MIIFLRPALALGLFVLAYTGYTDLFQTFELKHFDVGIINYDLSVKNRYIQIDNGFVSNHDAYAVEMDLLQNKLPTYIYYPLITKKEYGKVIITKFNDKLMKTKTHFEIPASVIIRRDVSNMNKNCLQFNSCISELYQQQADSGISVKGLTNTGEYSIVPSVRKNLKDLGFIIPEKVVVLEENYQPSAPWLGWLKLIGGVAGLLFTISAYIPRGK